MAKLLAPVWDAAGSLCVAGITQRSRVLHKKGAFDQTAMLRSRVAVPDSGRRKVGPQSTGGAETGFRIVDVTKLMPRKVNSQWFSLSLAPGSEDEARNKPMRRHPNLDDLDYVRSHGSRLGDVFYAGTAGPNSLAICGRSPSRVAPDELQGAVGNLLCRAPETPRTKKEQNSCRRITEKPRRSAFLSAQQRSSR